MATFFLDLDGTVLLRGTQDPSPGSLDWIRKAKEKGHKIIIVTRRGDEEFSGHPRLSREATMRALRELRIDYDEIIFDVRNPRIIIDDEACGSFEAERDTGSSDWPDLECYE
jgi:hypothetical protein